MPDAVVVVSPAIVFFFSGNFIKDIGFTVEGEETNFQAGGREIFTLAGNINTGTGTNLIPKGPQIHLQYTRTADAGEAVKHFDIVYKAKTPLDGYEKIEQDLNYLTGGTYANLSQLSSLTLCER